MSQGAGRQADATGAAVTAVPRPGVSLFGWLVTITGIGTLLLGSLVHWVLSISIALSVAMLSIGLFLEARNRHGRGNGHALVGIVAAGLVVAGTGIVALVPTGVAESLGLQSLATDSASGTQPSSVGSTSAPPLPNPVALQPLEATASRTAAPGQDSSGRAVTFKASNLIDHSTETAWRVGGDGRGEYLNFSFGRTVRLTVIGVVVGYDKVDEASGIDRFAQNRRIARARFVFSDGSAVDATFQDVRGMQLVEVDTATASVEMQIMDTTRPTERDFTAVSEVTFGGWEGGR